MCIHAGSPLLLSQAIGLSAEHIVSGMATVRACLPKRDLFRARRFAAAAILEAVQKFMHLVHRSLNVGDQLESFVAHCVRL
jgi:hypothetical protein